MATPSHEVKYRVQSAISYVAAHNENPWAFLKIAYGICSSLVAPPPAAIGRRRIATDNDHYRSNIGPIRGGRELFIAVGFALIGNDLVYTSTDTTPLSWAADEFLTASKRKVAPTTLASALATTAATGRSSPLPLPVSPTGPLPVINPHRSPSSSITGSQPLPPPPSFQQAMHLNVPFQPVSPATRSSSGGNGSAPSSPGLRPNGMPGGMEHSHSDNEWEMVDLPPAYEAPVGGSIVAYEAPVGEHKGQPIAVVPISPGGPNGMIPGGPTPQATPQVPPPFLSTVIAGRRDSGATTPSSLPLPIRPSTPSTPSTPQPFATGSPNRGGAGPIMFQSPRSTSPLPASRPASASIGAPSTPASNRAVPSPISVALAVPTTPITATTASPTGGAGTRTPRSPNSFPALTADQIAQAEAMGFKARTFQRAWESANGNFERAISHLINGVVTEEPGDSVPLVVASTPIVAVVATPVSPARPTPTKPFIGPIQPGGMPRPATPPIMVTSTPFVIPARSASPARGHEEKKASPTAAAAAGGSSTINAEALRQVLDFGFPEHDARRALARFDNNAERAVNALLSGTLEPAPALPVATPALTASGNASQPGLLRGASTDDIESVIRRLDAEEAANKRKQDAESARLAEAFAKEYSDNVERKKLAVRADTQAVRNLLETELKAGRPLKNEEMNFLNAPADHTEDKDYNCMSCYCDYKINGILITECHHFMCLACIKQYFETQINNGRAKDIKCPQPECDRLVSFSEVKRGVDKAFCEKYQEFLLDAHLKLDPQCRWCPRAGCGTPMIGNSAVPMMRCPKESCKFAYCFSCKEAWHQDVTCEKYQAWKAENKDAEGKYLAWQKANTKPCPKCHAAIEKNGGCNHMTCGGCRHQFCWLCAGEYKSGHFSAKGTPCNGKQFT